MKKIIKTITFSILSLYVVGNLLKSFSYQGDVLYGFLIIAIGFSFVNLFFPILTRFLSLPSKGIFFIIFFAIINFIFLFLFDMFVPQFYVVDGATPNLIFLGYMIPSVGLTQMKTMIVSALSLTVLYSFFSWLSSSSHKKKVK